MHDQISIHIIDLWVRQISIYGVYGPIATKFGMKMDLWPLMSGKILGFSYHGNKHKICTTVTMHDMGQ